MGPDSAGPWNFHERLDRGRGVITHWISEDLLSKKAQANLERAIDQLRQMPRRNWAKPAPASVIGDHTYVIRFKTEARAQLRIFGHFFDPHSAFAMTFHGNEKDDEYHPSNYQEVAQTHRASCDKDFLARTVKYKTRCAICE